MRLTKRDIDERLCASYTADEEAESCRLRRRELMIDRCIKAVVFTAWCLIFFSLIYCSNTNERN